jgi:ABC-type oligopeptide transport system substrate-binding subunit
MIIDNSCLGLANTQDEGSHLFWLSRSKGMTVDIWIGDYNPPRCFQKKISGRSKHNDLNPKMLILALSHKVRHKSYDKTIGKYILTHYVVFFTKL